MGGSNPPDTNEEGEISSLLTKQLREGTELIVVDPQRTRMAEKAAYWLQLRPGTDAALALVFLHVIIAEALYDQTYVQEWTNRFVLLRFRCKDYAPEVVAGTCGIDPGLIRESARSYAKGRSAAQFEFNDIGHYGLGSWHGSGQKKDRGSPRKTAGRIFASSLNLESGCPTRILA